MLRWVWSRNLVNDEAMTHWGGCRAKNRQTNLHIVEWHCTWYSHCGSLHHKKIQSAKILWKISRLNFLGSSSLIIFQRAELSTRSIAHLCWCNWRTFWRQNAAEGSPRGSCFCTKMPRLTGHLQPRINWPTWASNVLITNHILRIWPRRTTTCSLDWKKQFKWRNFSSNAEVIAATENWFGGQPSEFSFWVASKSYSNTLRSVGSMLNKSRVWSL